MQNQEPIKLFAVKGKSENRSETREIWPDDDSPDDVSCAAVAVE